MGVCTKVFATLLAFMPLVLGRPSPTATSSVVTVTTEASAGKTTTTTAPATDEAADRSWTAGDEDDRLRRSPQHFSFQDIGFEMPSFNFGFGENEIPLETQRYFTAPDPPTKELRDFKYDAQNRIEVPPHIHLVIHEEPYFDNLDHGHVVLSLQKRRKMQNLPPHMLKSLRPFFPFYSPN